MSSTTAINHLFGEALPPTPPERESIANPNVFQETTTSGSEKPLVAETELHTSGIVDPRDRATATENEAPIKETPVSRVTRILRILGALVLIASAISFAMQSWVGMGALYRYNTFLAFTAILSAAGIFCGLKLKEDKGARTLLAIAAAFLPAHFIQLGALLLSVTVGSPRGLPAFFVLQGPSLMAVLAVIAVATPILIAIAFSGFSAICRQEAPRLTLYYVIGNLTLLSPVRAPGAIALLALTLFASLIQLEIKTLSGRELLRTVDGLFTRLMLFAPVACLIARNLILYDTPAMMMSAILAMAATLFMVVIPRHLTGRQSVAISEGIAFACAGCAWEYFARATLLSSQLGLNAHYSITISYLPVALIIAAMSLVARVEPASYRKLAAWIGIGSVVLQLFVLPGILAAFLCILVGVAVTAGAFATEERALLYSGVFGLVAGLLYHLRFAAELYSISPWLSLAITGVVIVVGSSYVERNFRSIGARLQTLRGRLAEWN